MLCHLLEMVRPLLRFTPPDPGLGCWAPELVSGSVSSPSLASVSALILSTEARNRSIVPPPPPASPQSEAGPRGRTELRWDCDLVILGRDPPPVSCEAGLERASCSCELSWLLAAVSGCWLLGGCMWRLRWLVVLSSGDRRICAWLRSIMLEAEETADSCWLGASCEVCEIPFQSEEDTSRHHT